MSFFFPFFSLKMHLFMVFVSASLSVLFSNFLLLTRSSLKKCTLFKQWYLNVVFVERNRMGREKHFLCSVIKKMMTRHWMIRGVELWQSLSTEGWE